MIRAEIKKLIQEAIKSHWDVDLELAEIKIDYPPEGFGDYSANAAMNLAKIARSNPVEIAEEIAGKLSPFCHSEGAQRPKNLNNEILLRQPAAQDDTQKCLFEKIEVAKPGFINFYLTPEVLWESIDEINKAKENFGSLDIGKGKKVQVEFISANPTGPLTLGNGRGGFYGDVLANILKKVRFDVEREYYINDTGKQITILGVSVILSMGIEDSFIKQYLPWVNEYRNEIYKGNYILDLVEDFKKEFVNYKQKVLSEGLEGIGYWAALKIMEKNKKLIDEKMKVKFNQFFSERNDLKTEDYDNLFNLLRQKGRIFARDGASWLKGEKQERVLIRSHRADMHVRELNIRGKKVLDAVTYLFSDLAYHFNKFEKRKFDLVIDILGADHHGYAVIVEEAIEFLNIKRECLKIIIMQLVRLVSGGKEVKMSKRAGTYITIDELLDEIPLDVARFFFLMYSPDAHMNFDLDLAKEQSQKNPVFYVQYAYARICSILNKGGVARESEAKVSQSSADFHLLVHEVELKLIKQLIKFPEVIENIAYDYQVHRLPHYALDLVKIFHKFYEECRVIDEKNSDLTQARLFLVKAVQVVLKNTLDLMGISAPEKM